MGAHYDGSRISRSALQVEDEYDASPAASTSSSGTPRTEDFESIEDRSEEEDDHGGVRHRLEGNVNGTTLNRGPGLRPARGESSSMDGSVHEENEEMSDIEDVRSQSNMGDESSGFSGNEDAHGVQDDTASEDESDETGDEVHGDEDEDDEGEDVNGIIPQPDMSTQRAELRKMMGEEQKAVVARIAEATKADADKGRAIKRQRKAYDALLNARIRLQKGLVATNSLSAVPATENANPQVNDDAYMTAENAAMSLWDHLTELRRDLQHATLPTTATNNKRKLDEAYSSRPLLELWTVMEEQESAARSYRHATLEKWSVKVRGVTNLSLRRRLNDTAHQPTIIDMLHEHLSNTERLVKRTRIPRSCAPIQSQAGLQESADIYDDADFYQLQLKELVDQRLADSAAAPSSASTWAMNHIAALRDAKTKTKVVDTKASKGRKLRYTVHEKLQNFMAPEDRTTWGVRQAEELFGSLLGAKVRLEEDVDADDIDDGAFAQAEGGLKLFRS